MHKNYGDIKIGVGLRHAHYEEALASTGLVDFVEVHSENFYAEGGLTADLLNTIADKYSVSLHSTGLGLGSAVGMPAYFLLKLKELINRIDPILVSDHASYAWSSWQGKAVHMGELLPMSFHEQSLDVLCENVEKAQDVLQRQLLVENLSSYIFFDEDTYTETEFLTQLSKRTGCGLLVDLNNVLISAHNLSVKNSLEFAKHWLDSVPIDAVKEIHLAGHTKPTVGNLIVDDHSKPVNEECWNLFEYSVQRFGNVPTLIEWDNGLPSWQRLLEEANTARSIAQKFNSLAVGVI